MTSHAPGKESETFELDILYGISHILFGSKGRHAISYDHDYFLQVRWRAQGGGHNLFAVVHPTGAELWIVHKRLPTNHIAPLVALDLSDPKSLTRASLRAAIWRAVAILNSAAVAKAQGTHR
jgi:hypothetical protein